MDVESDGSSDVMSETEFHSKIDPMMDSMFQGLEQFAKAMTMLDGMVATAQEHGWTADQARGIVYATYIGAMNPPTSHT